MVLTDGRSAAQFAKHLDMAAHQPWLTRDELLVAVRAARDNDVAAFYSNTFWTSLVAEELSGTNVRVGAAVGFPLGNSASEAKLAEVDCALVHGATAVDMVVNIGAWRDGDSAVVRGEVSELVARCAGRAITKLIFEVPYLTCEEIARLTELCCELGVDYVKSSTGPETGPNETQVQTMLDRTAGSATRVKVSGVPRPFTLAACLWLLDLGVDLIGTGKAPQLVEGYRALIGDAPAHPPASA